MHACPVVGAGIVHIEIDVREISVKQNLLTNKGAAQPSSSPPYMEARRVHTQSTCHDGQ